MEYRRFGNTGLKVSAISYGNMLNNTSEKSDIDDSIVAKCLEKGINFFDTAEMYADGQSEKALGRAFQKSNVDRQDIVVTTKIFRVGKNINSFNNTNRKHIIQSVDGSLKRLNLDYVDVVFAHSFDEFTSVEETCRGFNQVIQDGKAFYWATSNWSAQSIYQAFEVCDRLGLHKPVADQCQYNMFVRENMEVQFETLFDRYNYGTIIWNPLGSGFLTQKFLAGNSLASKLYDVKKADPMKKYFYEQYNNSKSIEIIKELQKVAKSLGGNVSQLAIAWTLNNPNVSTAKIGAAKPEEIEELLGGLELYKKLTPEIENKINKILDNSPRPKFNFKENKNGNFRRAVQQKITKLQ